MESLIPPPPTKLSVECTIGFLGIYFPPRIFPFSY